MISACRPSRSRNGARGSTFWKPWSSSIGRPEPRRSTSSSMPPTDRTWDTDDPAGLLMAARLGQVRHRPTLLHSRSGMVDLSPLGAERVTAALSSSWTSPSFVSLIQEKLAAGRLPNDHIPRIWGGPGNGETCDGCEETVTKGSDRDGESRRDGMRGPVSRRLLLRLGRRAPGARTRAERREVVSRPAPRLPPPRRGGLRAPP